MASVQCCLCLAVVYIPNVCFLMMRYQVEKAEDQEKGKLSVMKRDQIKFTSFSNELIS